MKLNKQQIESIKKQVSEGKKPMEIKKEFNVSLSTIQYHTNKKVNEQKKTQSKNWFKNLSKEERKKIYNKRKEYWKNYTKNRYHTDEEYRKRMIQHQINYKKRKNGEKRI